MLDFSLTEEERAIRDTARRFITNEVMPYEAMVLRNEAENLPDFDPDLVTELRAKARKIGFWGVETPEQYGGMGLGPVMTAVLKMETARTFVPFTFGGWADNIMFLANEEQMREYTLPTIEGDRRSCFALTEPGAGSDARNLSTTAKRDGDDWLINGEKIFITGGTKADYVIVFARSDDDGGVTCFLVDRAMGWTSSPIRTMGSRRPASIHFDNVRVPSRNVLGEVGGGFAVAMQWIAGGRWGIPAEAVGAAERILGIGIEYAKNREQFGSPIADFQAIQWMIADSQVEIESAKLLTLFAAWREQQGLDSRQASSIAKLHAATMANSVVDRVLQIHGGMGYSSELPIERWYRELRLLRIFEGTDEIQRRTIARNLIRGRARLGEIG